MLQPKLTYISQKTKQNEKKKHSDVKPGEMSDQYSIHLWILLMYVAASEQQQLEEFIKMLTSVSEITD